MWRQFSPVAALVSGVVCLAGSPAGAPWQLPTDEEFERTHTFPYLAPRERSGRVRAGVPQLRRCMREAEIRQLLGDPDHGHVSLRMNTDIPEVQVWHYVLAQESPKQQKADARVVVWLHLDGRLRAVSVYAVPGLTGMDSVYNEKCS